VSETTLAVSGREPVRGDAAGWPSDAPTGSITFIVRLFGQGTGGLTGIVEQVRTGRKERFTRLEEIGGVIASLMPVGEPFDQASGDGADR
jgi:hypothetical protein